MKLDFSILSKSSRGEMGTLGTPAFTRPPVSPELPPSQDKIGDRLSAPDMTTQALPPPVPTASTKMGTLQSCASAMSPLSPPVPMKNGSNDSYWPDCFEQYADVVEDEGSMARNKAEQQAYESRITNWLDTHPPAHTNDAICPHCHKPIDTPRTLSIQSTSSIRILTGNGARLWLHYHCLDSWQARRRQEAITALAEILTGAKYDSGSF